MHRPKARKLNDKVSVAHHGTSGTRYFVAYFRRRFDAGELIESAVNLITSTCTSVFAPKLAGRH
jgi:hypothetical protein